MCFQDIKIGRNTETKLTAVTIGAAIVSAVGRDARRIALIFPATEVGPYNVYPEGITTLTQGWTVSLATGPLIMTIDRFGDLVRGAYGIAHAATAGPVGVAETNLKDDSVGKDK
jgi:hypothetical protein